VEWIKWVTLIAQRAHVGNPSHPGILEVIMHCPEGKDFGVSPKEEMTHAEEAHCITSCQKIRNSMPCSRMDPVAL